MNPTRCEKHWGTVEILRTLSTPLAELEEVPKNAK